MTEQIIFTSFYVFILLYLLYQPYTLYLKKASVMESEEITNRYFLSKRRNSL